MLGTLLERDRLRCCDVFDCRRTGTPLADHCVTELALGHEGPLPELRLDLPGPGGSVSSVWVTGSPYGGAEPAVVLQVRPGVAGDRRRRTEPHWMGGPHLRVFALGRSRVESRRGAARGGVARAQAGRRPQVPRRPPRAGRPHRRADRGVLAGGGAQGRRQCPPGRAHAARPARAGAPEARRVGVRRVPLGRLRAGAHGDVDRRRRLRGFRARGRARSRATGTSRRRRRRCRGRPACTAGTSSPRRSTPTGRSGSATGCAIWPARRCAG